MSASTPAGESTGGPWLRRDDILLVLRRPHGEGSVVDEPRRASPQPAVDHRELFLAVTAAGEIVGFNGHVDLGTGIRTALAQIVAEELDVPVASVTMELGHTGVTPDQGATIASESLQVAAIPLRQAAACARRALLALAAERLTTPLSELETGDGAVRVRLAPNKSITYGDLVRGGHREIALDPDVEVKASGEYRIVGTSVARVDVPLKATGEWQYVHDVRVPGMLHGRVVRPPYAGSDNGAHVGTSLIEVDESSIADVEGVVAVVVEGDFVGVVAQREEDAHEAARKLVVKWRPWGGLAQLTDPQAAIRANRSNPRRLYEKGDVERTVGAADRPMSRTYVWPYQMHGSIGPSCAVAAWDGTRLVAWSGTQNPYMVRADLAALLDLAPGDVEVRRHEAAGCYGRNCADDVTADAALLSRAVGRPVRVQLTREQEHAWEPKGAAQVMDVRGGLDREGGPAGYDFETSYPSNGAPTLALLLTGRIGPTPAVFEMGDRTAVPPYAFRNARVTVHDMPPIARASWFRGVSALPNTFAHESFMDELAAAAGVDPIEYRLRYLTDPRATDLVRAVAERARWTPRTRHGTEGAEGDVLRGRGFAYAVYVHGKAPGTAAAWAAWIADVSVNRRTGEVAVTRVVAGQDHGQTVNPDGVLHQIHGNVIQSTSRVLKERVDFDIAGVASLEWSSYPIISFPEIPAVDVVTMNRPGEPPLGAGESASVPSAAAIANAIYDATGVRFREVPFDAERIKAALARPLAGPKLPATRRSRLAAALTGAVSASVLLGATALPWKPSIATIERPDPAMFSPLAIERGRLVAALGACAACHSSSDLAAFAGGRGLHTPFGTVYASNISPDLTAGIGAWPYSAFERAMRAGVSRDGHHLYPAHPYTSFARSNEADLQALYAFLMTQPASARPVRETRLRFPFGARPLMAFWNLLFLRQGTPARNATKSDAWNRGAYLVEGLGHCGACHGPRNIMGAEKGGAVRLAGGTVAGWHAPALDGSSRAPVPWTKEALFQYLRTGRSSEHGGAAGPMADVVASLAPLPDSDLEAMAVYLADLAASTRSIEPTSSRIPSTDLEAMPGARLYEGACAICHEGGQLVGLNLNTALHADAPDNLLQAVLHGVGSPSARIPGRTSVSGEAAMPPFQHSFGNRQLADLAAYLRSRFAPDKAEWRDLGQSIARAREAPIH